MYSAGLLFCPSCYRMTEFATDAMPRPGYYPAAECVVCEFEYAEGVVSDAVRAEAIEKIRAERIQNAPRSRRR